MLYPTNQTDQQCMHNSTKVSSTDWDRLNKDFSREELCVALTSIQNGKSPSMDGLPYEFYNIMWDTIGDDFCCLASQVLTVGRLS